MLTLGQAAKLTGLSKPTLSKYIKRGDISAVKKENGEYSIEPSELDRYISTNRQQSVNYLQLETPINDGNLQFTLNALQEVIDQLKSERDNLRTRLDKSEEAREKAAADISRMTLLLTHKPETTVDQSKRPWWSVSPWLLVVFIIGVIIAAFLFTLRIYFV
jgi:excisionase family DNA binding protein